MQLYSKANHLLGSLIPSAACVYLVNATRKEFPISINFAMTHTLFAAFVHSQVLNLSHPLFPEGSLDRSRIKNLTQQDPKKLLCHIICIAGTTYGGAVAISQLTKAIHPIAFSLSVLSAYCFSLLTTSQINKNLEKSLDRLEYVKLSMHENENNVAQEENVVSDHVDPIEMIKKEIEVFPEQKLEENSINTTTKTKGLNPLDCLAIGILTYPIIMRTFPSAVLSHTLTVTRGLAAMILARVAD